MDASQTHTLIFGSLSSVEWRALESLFWLSLHGAPLGAMLIFRRLSFLGDALGHGAVGGVALALFVGAVGSLWLGLGALLSILVCVTCLWVLENKMQLASDLALTVSYTGLFSMGLLILGSSHQHLDHLLLGDLWNVSVDHLWFLRIWTFVFLFVIVVAWKRIWLSLIDPRLARLSGWSPQFWDLVVLSMAGISVAGMIQAVGAVLVTAYLILPAAAALPWAPSLLGFVALSFGMAVVSSVLGFLGSQHSQMTTGPSIAFAAFLCVILSHLLRRLWVHSKQGRAYNKI